MTVLALSEAAKEMRISRGKLYELIKSGEIPHVQFGRERRVDLDDIAAWFQKQKTKTFKPGPITNPNLGKRKKK